MRPWWRWFSQIYESLYRAELDRAAYYQEANGDLVDEVFFVADRGFVIEAVREIHSVAGSDAGAVSVGITKDTGTDAPAAGVAVLTTGLSLKATANTVQSGVLTATPADLGLVAGDRLSVSYTGVLTGVAGVCVVITMRAV